MRKKQKFFIWLGMTAVWLLYLFFLFYFFGAIPAFEIWFWIICVSGIVVITIFVIAIFHRE
jgi:hypothetical protein